jgi:hypothetical protein
MNPTADWNIDELEGMLDYARDNLVPSGGTNYGPPFAIFERELNERGAGANDSFYRHRQLNFGIFLTDGLATDYKPNFSTKVFDYPFSDHYSAPSYYGEDVISEFCNARGWCDSSDVNCANVVGNPDAKDCVTANIIHAVKNTSGTTIVGIYVGDEKGDGPRVLHSVSSCDSFPFQADSFPFQACNNTFSAETFDDVRDSVIPTVNNLMLEAQALHGVCQKCEIGMYSPVDGAKCEYCPEGQYGSADTLTGCSSCPFGKYSTVLLPTSEQDCWPTCGSLDAGGINVLCSGDNYDQVLNTDHESVVCSSSTCASDQDRSTCCKCKLGYEPELDANGKIVCKPTCGSLDANEINVLCSDDN